jgi:hypothetical protein
MKRARKLDPDIPYKIWLCYLLASVAKEDAELPSQYDAAFEVVGKPLGLGAKSVGRYSRIARDLLNDVPPQHDAKGERVPGYSRIARELLKDAKGERVYHDWLNKRERMWWLYHVLCVEKKKKVLLEYVGEMEGDTLILTRGDVHITPKEAEPLIREAKKRLTHGWGEGDYQAWFGEYKRRSPQNQRSPWVYRPLPDDHPAAIAMDEARAAAGLRNNLTKRGRPRRAN